MPTPLPDYYALLEVPASATLEQIKQSYRRLVRRYHPDLNAQARDDHIKLLNEAYAVLSDATRRAAYNTLRQRQEQAERIATQIREQQAESRRKTSQDPPMTWTQGIIGFVRELRKAMRE
jgi:curved DNA-binding protein CbpA